MSILVGSTGFVGGHLGSALDFDISVHRSDVGSIRDSTTDLLVCAGLPAAKWQANMDPAADWANMASLASVLSTVRAEQAVLISTIDVFQPAVNVDETSPVQFEGPEAYGAHRAWFESFFRAQFEQSVTLRLPGLYAADVRKNLVHDLLHGKADQYARINPGSTFQFFDAARTWEIAQSAMKLGLSVLNVAAEPVRASDVAAIFDVTLTGDSPRVGYDMKSVHAGEFGGSHGYLFSRQVALAGIAALRQSAGRA